MLMVQEIEEDVLRRTFGLWQDLCDQDSELPKFPQRADSWLTKAVTDVFSEGTPGADKELSAYIRINKLLRFAEENEERLRFLRLVKIENGHRLIAIELFEIFSSMKVSSGENVSFKKFMRVRKAGLHKVSPISHKSAK